jgi:DNA helicase-2/ATP-dependent DNA helicase PcrA
MVLQLTNEQSKPVNSNCKINVVLSVPGSGKTTVLIARAERLWHETREPTLIVTFSSDACNNILKRIAPEVKLSTDVKTIHSFCFDVVKNYWRELGEICGGEYWPLEPKLISKEQEIEVISELFKEDNALDIYERFFYLRSLATNPEQLLRLFKKKVYFDRIRSSDIEKFIVFEKARLSKGLINFDDMIDLAEVLIPLPYVSTDLSRRYSHLLIDEAQDQSYHQS